MKIQDYEFSLREFGGSLGDFGTLLPFTVGYIVICGFEPAGLLFGIGLTNIFLALIYKIPLPVQPKKVVGSVALSQAWSVSQVLGAGFGLGVIWVVLSLSQRLSDLLMKVPKPVVRGIQLGLAITLALTGVELMKPQLVLSLIFLGLGFLMLRNRYLPGSIFLVLFGFIYSIYTGNLDLSSVKLGFSLPSLHFFSIEDILYGFIYAGFAQLFLTLTNAVIATVSLVHELFPERRDVTPKNLIMNMGIMNITTPFIGGMPLCHGAGGLAAQYMFGARTGGAILMEGLLEVGLGLFFSTSIQTLFTAFPQFITGVMLLMASVELGKIAFKVEGMNASIVLFTALISTVFNIAIGFAAGLVLHYTVERKIISIGD
jgi:MFS superfamily sulfate permease-like transporter